MKMKELVVQLVTGMDEKSATKLVTGMPLVQNGILGKFVDGFFVQEYDLVNKRKIGGVAPFMPQKVTLYIDTEYTDVSVKREDGVPDNEPDNDTVYGEPVESVDPVDPVDLD